jgi:SAM-dependent methyltransferase
VKGYDDATYGDRWAEIYDEYHTGADWLLTEPAVETLADLAGGGPVLELAIGTGRLALPLAERGLEIQGIDASEEMVARLRAKPGGDRIPVTMGDFGEVGVDGRYRLIFIAFNTLFGLLTQDAQLRCFRNVAAHLTDDGVFAIEVFVPDVTRFDRGQRIGAVKVELDEVVLEASQHDPVSQVVSAQNLIVRESGVRLYPTVIRYAYPSELDLMARLAGLRLRDRWANWRRDPFTRTSLAHVSVYERASESATAGV